MVSPDTGNIERDDLKGTRPNLGRWHLKSHYGIPCVLATAIIPRNTTFSLNLNARGTCAKSVWSSLMRSICSDRCPLYEASVDDVSPVVFSYLSSLCLFLFCSNQYWYHDAPTIHAILYRWIHSNNNLTTCKSSRCRPMWWVNVNMCFQV